MIFSYGIKIWIDLSSVLSQSTRLTDGRTDRQTDGQTEFSSLDRVCILCSAVKMGTAPRLLPTVFKTIVAFPDLCRSGREIVTVWPRLLKGRKEWGGAELIAVSRQSAYRWYQS